MNIRAIKCTNCGDTIYSRANHDYMTCTCGKCSIDGGQDSEYYWVSADADYVEDATFEMDTTLQELYDDWNEGTDKLGRKK